MREPLLTATLILAAYALGTIPFAVLYSRLIRGLDPRSLGNLNPGAANVFRKVGKRVGIATGVSDAAKTLVPIVICRALDLPLSSWALVGAAGTLGHCYPVWTRFRGGLGLASAIGMALAIIPLPMTIAIAAGIVVLFVIKNVGWSSLAGLSIAIALALAFDEPASRIAVAPIGAVISFLKTNLLTQSAEKRKKINSTGRLPSP